MKLNVITYAHEWSRLADSEFAFKSTNQALIGLEEGDYYDLLDMSCRVEKYIRMSSREQWSASKREIVTRKREEARENERAARKSLEDAVAHAPRRSGRAHGRSPREERAEGDRGRADAALDCTPRQTTSMPR